MRRMLVILASSVLFLPALALAQHRGGMVVMRQPMVASPHVVAGPAQSAGTHVVSTGPHAGMTVVARRTRVVTTTVHHTGTFVNLPVFPIDFANSPGLGFDFPHMAAISGPHTRGRFRGIVPFGFSSFLLTSPSVIVEEPQGENQQPVVEEIVAANPSDVEREPVRARRSETQNLSEVSAEPPAPQHDAPEYVFVRRDGGLLFAVAYSWENGTLRYVTRDGLRRSVTQDTLDMDATQQFNEQRGVNFRSPA
jgi:hypothetical protein